MHPILNLAIMTRVSGFELHSHPPQSMEYIYLSHAIILATLLFRTDQVRHILITLALEFDDRAYKGKLFEKDYTRAASQVDILINKLALKFPAVVIDQTMTNPNNLAYHNRGSWVGSSEEFDTRLQMIHVNA